jgi:ATP-dependent helicase HrpB
VVNVPAQAYPLETRHMPGTSLGDAVVAALNATPGSVLAFLPGAAEIRRAMEELAPRLRGRGIECVGLHGSIDAETQAAIVAGDNRRVILATNVAETSLTVAGVTAVVDTGLHKVARFDPARGLDRLELERITADSASQRAGRAGRIGPGLVIRLWDPRDRLRPHREPEIQRIDLSAPALDVAAAGEDARRFEWFQAPDATRLEAALALLARIDAIDARGRATPHGQRLRSLPLPPRLAQLLVAAGGSRDAARVAALLSERSTAAPGTPSNILSHLDDLDRRAPHAASVARELERLCRQTLGDVVPLRDDESLRRVILSAYPDRVGRLRDEGGDRLVLSSGVGARLTAPDLADASFIVALDLGASAANAEAIVRLAVRVEASWLSPTATLVKHWIDPGGVVRAVRQRKYDALVLDEHAVAPEKDERARLLAEARLARGPSAEDDRLRRRLEFAGLPADWESLVKEAARDAMYLADVDPRSHLDPRVVRTLDRLAPDSIAVPSGRRVRLDYTVEGGVVAAVKLQELFGLGDTPRVGPRSTPVVFHLLAPNGRPVQTTSDLRSFWNGTYAEVRRELRGRYPRHPWPEDPWTAPPTRKPKPRG